MRLFSQGLCFVLFAIPSATMLGQGCPQKCDASLTAMAARVTALEEKVKDAPITKQWPAEKEAPLKNDTGSKDFKPELSGKFAPAWAIVSLIRWNNKDIVKDNTVVLHLRSDSSVLLEQNGYGSRCLLNITLSADGTGLSYKVDKFTEQNDPTGGMKCTSGSPGFNLVFIPFSAGLPKIP